MYGWALSQKLSVDGFMWVEDTSQFNGDFIKTYNEKSDERYFLELHDLYYNLPFLPERIKVKKVEKLHDNSNSTKIYLVKLNILFTYCGSRIYINNGLVLNKILRVIKFNQKAWLKPYIDLNIKLKT